MLQFVRLRVVGFKSFVEPAELLIEPGLTGIVGPNGCGKSNLVDALRWVMGESSSRTLRGGEMEDVIFAGTDRRPGRGFAEVVLTLDNRAGAAPHPFREEPELEVSRRLERGRGSLFRINGREVRARDVQLLFADHAAGARSAAMVTQGQVAQLIAARPLERRALIEEAAGIGGLASRRAEAEGRLAATAQNLTRVNDVLEALAAQCRSLEEQAAQAARYRTLSATIRRLEAQLLARQWRRAEAAVAAAGDRRHALAARVTDLSQGTVAASERRAAAVAALAGLRGRLTAATEALHAAERACDRLAGEEALAVRAAAEGRERCEQLARELVRERERAAEAKAAVERLAAERARLAARAAGDGEDAARLRAEIADLGREVVAVEAALAAEDRRLAAAAAERSALRQTAAAAAGRAERLRHEAAALDRQLTALANDQGGAIDPLAAALAAAEAERAAAGQRLTAAGAALATARQAAETADAAAHRLATRLARLEAEERALAAVVADVPAAARPVLAALNVDAALLPALAAAFGEELLAGIDDGGPSHWRPLATAAPLPPLPAGIPPLSARIGAPPALARSLAAVGLADSAERAEAAFTALAPGQRLVTADGRLWRWDGYVRAPAAGGGAFESLRHRERLAALATEIAAGRTERDAAAALAGAARAALAAAESAEHEAREAERQAERRLAAARERLHAARREAARRDGERAQLAARRRQLEAQLREALAEAEAAAAAVARLPDPAGGHAALAPQRQALADRREVLMERRSRLAALERDADGRQRRLAALARELADWQRRADDGHLAALAARCGEAQAALVRLAARPPALAAERAAAEAERGARAQEREALAAALATAEAEALSADERLRTMEAEAAAAREALIRAEADLAQALAERTQLARTIGERLGSEALASLDAEAEEEGADEAGAAKRLERLRRERDLMGAVNLRAEDELAALNRERERLRSERADLEAAIGKLRRAIGNIDGESRERLTAAFTAIDGHFRALFQRLFGGGRAELRLTEGDDPLSCGLEIFASPPGKRLTLLSLLSGGEQALTALALRFAVFLARPAPICVLDEVDAPLDDANVQRFLGLLADLAGRGTRFLIVTHHRLTMARMDRLFGVTMAEKGVSALFSVDLGRAEGLRQRA